MKKLRDIECVKMKEASSALFMIKNKVNRSWTEELLAESILLETHLRYQLIVSKIRESKDLTVEPKQHKLTGSVTLSNLQYELTPHEKKGNSSIFYLLTVSHDTTLLTSKAIQAVDNRLNFNETFSLSDLSEDFELKVEIFSIELNTAKRGIVDKLLKRKPKCCYPINKIYYENVNTAELKESTILNSSFTSRAEFSITPKDIGSSIFLTKKQQTYTGILTNSLKATLKVNDMNLKTKHEGFLTLGKEDEDSNVHYWERKWCSLNGNTFFIYNYPQDKEQDKPAAAKINLEYCLIPLAKNPSDCPRKRTFVLRTGRPRTLNDSSFLKKLGDKDNFILNKYYLSADNKEDFDTWTGLLDMALQHLNSWNKLVFKE